MCPPWLCGAAHFLERGHLGCAGLGRCYIQRPSVDGVPQRAVETRIARKPPQRRCDQVEWEPSCSVDACLPAFGYSHCDHRRHTLAWSGHAAKSDAILVVSARGRGVYSGSCAKATSQRQHHPGGHRWTACRHYRRRFRMAQPGCARSHDSWADALGTWHRRRRCAARRCVGARPLGGRNLCAARRVRGPATRPTSRCEPTLRRTFFQRRQLNEQHTDCETIAVAGWAKKRRDDHTLSA